MFQSLSKRLGSFTGPVIGVLGGVSTYALLDNFAKNSKNSSAPALSVMSLKGEEKIYSAARVLPRADNRNMDSREWPHRPRLSEQPKKLPTIPLDEVKKHYDPHKSIWVTWKGGVFDVTPFIKAHPGGFGRLSMAGGQDLCAFWRVYKLHYRPHIQSLIQDFRIGNLSEEDRKRAEKESQFSSGYVDEPPRPRNIISIRSERPWNGEVRLSEFTKSFYTPNEFHYTRNHNPVPRVDPEDYEFHVVGNEKLGIKDTFFTLDELKTLFEPTNVPCTLQCAGNRQEDMVSPDRPLFVEAKWRDGAFGTALWTGVKLRDVLKHCGMPLDDVVLGKEETSAKYVNCTSMDADETGNPYASYIPFQNVLDPWGDVILAYKMNGVDLPRDHGYPIRLLCSGLAGFRNCKWLEEVEVSDDIKSYADQKNQHFDVSTSFRGHYIPGRRGEGPTPDLMDVSAPRVIRQPVTSIICEPGQGETIPGDVDHITVKGIAWVGGGRGINRVEVSLDGGTNFYVATLKPRPYKEPRPGYDYAWKQWTIDLKLTDEHKKALKKGEKVDLEVVARAQDKSLNKQPESIEEVQNVLGKGINHWPRKMVTIDPKYKTGDADIPPHFPTPPPGQWEWKRTYHRFDLDNNEEWLRAYEKDFVNMSLDPPPRSEWSKLSPYVKANDKEGEIYYNFEEGSGSTRPDKSNHSPEFERNHPDMWKYFVGDFVW